MHCEKSCGAVVYTRTSEGIRYVIITSREGIHGFPKGHMEGNETEEETALREIREEVGLKPKLIPGFRVREEYPLPQKPGTGKQVIFFLAEYAGQTIVPQESELAAARLMSYEEAQTAFEYENNRAVLAQADAFLRARERGVTAVRRAEEKDIPAILRLLSQVLELHAALRPDVFISGTTKYTGAELAAMLRDDSRPVYVAADADGAVLGYAFCVLKAQPFSTNMVPFTSLFIDDLCVDESARGQHVGSRLFAFVKEEAKRLGCYEVTLNVWEGNDRARAFYEHMGMKPKETQMEIIL